MTVTILNTSGESAIDSQVTEVSLDYVDCHLLFIDK